MTHFQLCSFLNKAIKNHFNLQNLNHRLIFYHLIWDSRKNFRKCCNRHEKIPILHRKSIISQWNSFLIADRRINILSIPKMVLNTAKRRNQLISLCFADIAVQAEKMLKCGARDVCGKWKSHYRRRTKREIELTEPG